MPRSLRATAPFLQGSRITASTRRRCRLTRSKRRPGGPKRQRRRWVSRCLKGATRETHTEHALAGACAPVLTEGAAGDVLPQLERNRRLFATKHLTNY